MKKKLIELASKYENIKDIVSGSSPKNEVELSSVFSVLCQNKKIDFKRINLYTLDEKKVYLSDMNMEALISDNTLVLNEFPLFSTTKEEVSEWGGMSIDIALINDNSITFIENKIGSKFTSGGTQLRRQLNYLKNIKGIDDKNKNLILLSSKQFFDKRWYLETYVQAIKDTNSSINCYCIYWEEIFEATI
jgi:hypothetical protein